MSPCDCHEQANQIAEKGVLRVLLVVNGVMFAVELAVGLLAESTGLMADSLDMLADATVYGVALYAVGRSGKVKVRAARFSGWFQIALAAGVLFDILRRFIVGSEPESWLMMGIGLIALVANVSCLLLLAKHRNGEVHMRASWIFSKNDVIANAGVILAGFLVYLSGTRWPDLAIGLVIAGFVLNGGIQILRESAEADPCRGERSD
ncbi:MAG: cation transporter, partial [Verrucomicrobiae bacterium]|nr:cation transporter [Verrucomicrobiae bacterium]